MLIFGGRNLEHEDLDDFHAFDIGSIEKPKITLSLSKFHTHWFVIS